MKHLADDCNAGLECYCIHVLDYIDISSKDNVVLELCCGCGGYSQKAREFAISSLRPPFYDVGRH